MSYSADEVCAILRKPLSKFTRAGGKGTTYDYYKGSDVIRRLNEAFGHAWSSEKLDTSVVDGQVLMLVSLSTYMGGELVVHHGYGSAKIMPNVDIGNAYKSAFTSALKKAAEQYGIGLEDEEEPEVQYSRPAPTNYAPAALPPAPPTATSYSRPAMHSPEALPTRGLTGAPNRGLLATAAAAVSNYTTSPAPDPITSPTLISTPDLGDEALTNTQETAISRLAKMRQLDEAKLIAGALPAGNKTSVKELTRSEAIQVIKYASNPPTQR